MAEKKKILILNDAEVNARLERMAYQILEANIAAENILLLGIGKRGAALAKALQKYLTKVAKAEITLLNVKKSKQGLAWTFEIEQIKVKNNPIIIIDDVIYSGKTLFNAVQLLLPQQPSKIEIAVLVDRGHRNLPVQANYIGLKLATTLQQHVSFEQENQLGKDAKVYLI